MIGPWPESNPGQLLWVVPADFFLRLPNLTASNVTALWPTDQKFLTLKDLFFFPQCVEFQGADSILKVGFALSKWPHLNRVYLVTVRKHSSMAVFTPVIMPLPRSCMRKSVLVPLTSWKEIHETFIETVQSSVYILSSSYSSSHSKYT